MNSITNSSYVPHFNTTFLQTVQSSAVNRLKNKSYIINNLFSGVVKCFPENSLKVSASSQFVYPPHLLKVTVLLFVFVGLHRSVAAPASFTSTRRSGRSLFLRHHFSVLSALSPLEFL